MRQRHPWPALVFMYTVDLAALGLIVYQWPLLFQYGITDWLATIMFAAVMAASRVRPLQSPDSSAVLYGWYMAAEFAVIAALPVPLACVVHLPWVPLGILRRIKSKAPEPFRGPDFTVATAIICAFMAGHLLTWLFGLTGGTEGLITLLLLPVTGVFMFVQYLLLTILISLDRQVPWNLTGLFNADSLIGDLMMVLLGALIGRLYTLDSSTILLTLVPLGLLQRFLQKMHQAKLANYDAKTNLYNYRYLDQALTEEVRRATQSGRPLALIFGDMDYLRDINNTYGHLAGDRALKAVATVFKRNARQGDVAARFGGEEFVLLLPGLEKDQAFEVAERIRRETEAQRLETDDGGVFSVTVSLGLAAFPRDGRTVQGLIKAADEAVYDAKHAGRNQVRCARRTEVAI